MTDSEKELVEKLAGKPIQRVGADLVERFVKTVRRQERAVAMLAAAEKVVATAFGQITNVMANIAIGKPMQGASPNHPDERIRRFGYAERAALIHAEAIAKHTICYIENSRATSQLKLVGRELAEG